MLTFLLASQSPRRRELIRLARYPYQVLAADVDESAVALPDPATNSVETARLKANVVLDQHPDLHGREVIIIAADTNVALDDDILGKPEDTADARRMLLALRDREHRVHTGLALIDLRTGREVTAVHSATVTMRAYGDAEIERYLDSGDPMDKAGAYAIQHPKFDPVAALDGCFLGVMGLSICQLLTVLRRLDIPDRADYEALASTHRHFSCPLLAESGHFR